MAKIGHAFPDFIIEDRMKPRKYSPKGASPEFVALFPIVALIIIAAIILLRLFYLQVLRGEYYSFLSEDNRTQTKVIPASRGIIFDRKGRPLVSNSPSFKILEKETITWLDKDEALSLIADGKEVDNDVQRDYVYKDLFSHVVGYIGQVSEEELKTPEFSEYSHLDQVGKMGLERQYEEVLHGINGKEIFEVDARGKIVRSLGIEEPRAGKNITTTLDVDIQKAVYDSFKDVRKGAVIVSDPRSGAILSIYSKPSFDPNIFTHPKSYMPEGDYASIDEILKDTDNQPVLDRAIGGAYPPGSTFKLITAAAALEENAITEDTIIEDTGFIEVGGTRFGTWYHIQYGRTEGSMDIIKAMARSNDIFFYKAADMTGIEKLDRWMKTFGLGGKLGIDIPEEAEGTVPSPDWKMAVLGENWYTGDTFNTGIGQGYVLTTPLQVNTWTNVFANKGILYRPHLVSKEKHKLNDNFLTSETIALVREGMRKSCEEGGVAFSFFNFGVENRNLKIDGEDFQKSASNSADFVRIPVGCKTGTAETPGEDSDPHAWISVFAPFHDPEISVTVLVENGGEGSQVAGPIATEILKKYFEKR